MRVTEQVLYFFSLPSKNLCLDMAGIQLPLFLINVLREAQFCCVSVAKPNNSAVCLRWKQKR